MARIFDEAALSRSRDRLAWLLAEASGDAHTSKEHLQVFVQELTTGLEELLVAEEELRVQGEELTASVAAIDAERERYGELFEFAPDAYLVTDDQGKILEANGAASALLGVPARYLDGKLIVSFVDESRRRDVRDLLSGLAGGDVAATERYLPMRAREGALFTAEVRVASRREKDATIVRWVIRDITQRLQLEEDLRFLHNEVELLTSLSRVSRLMAEPQGRDTMLTQVVALAAQALPECEISVAVAVHDRPQFAASSGDRARRLAAAEADQGDGPCLTAMRDNAVIELSTEEAVARWPRFGAAAEAEGLEATRGHPLTTPGGQRGAINVYAFGSLSDEARAFIPVLADQVVLALTNTELYEGAHTLATHLQRALESRGVIEQAKGVLIARQGCTEDQAFDILRRASQRLNRKLRDVASDLVAHVQEPKQDAAAPDPNMDASIARARGREMRARDRAEDERERADAARAGTAGPRQQAAAAHDRARALHERAADLQRRHQVELSTGETRGPDPAVAPPE